MTSLLELQRATDLRSRARAFPPCAPDAVGAGGDSRLGSQSYPPKGHGFISHTGAGHNTTRRPAREVRLGGQESQAQFPDWMSPRRSSDRRMDPPSNSAWRSRTRLARAVSSGPRRVPATRNPWASLLEFGLNGGESVECSSRHSNRDRRFKLFGSHCGDCHEAESWKITGFRHPGPASRDCSQCHQAPPGHYMEHFGWFP